MTKRAVSSSRAALRLDEACAWLVARAPGEEVLVVGASRAAASEVSRRAAAVRGTGFGWHQLGLGGVAVELAKLELAARDLVSVGVLPFEALCARVLQRLRGEGRLGRFAALVDQPGMPRALARTLTELRLAGVTGGVEPALAAALEALDAELAAAKLADRALVYRVAIDVIGHSTHSWLACPLLLVDVPLHGGLDRDLVAALVARAPEVLATIPAGDDRTRRELGAMLGVVDAIDDAAAPASLARVQRELFAAEPSQVRAELDDTVAILSAPGESRECVEIARRILREAERGVPFDRMAVLVRTPSQYRVHLEEALGRAGVPAHFDHGTVLPDPSGRAFLALLACGAESLSARRFAEYLSLGEVPDAVAEGAPPPPAAAGDRWVPPDEELMPMLSVRGDDAAEPDANLDAPVVAGSLRTPWRWERLLVEAAVIGGRERWDNRLAGLDRRMRLEDELDADADDATRGARARRLADLAHLRAYALPLLDELAALPHLASWGDWLDRLTALATRALRHPTRVLEVLAALAPMRQVGPVDLREVRLALHPHLAELTAAPSGARFGKVLVAPIEAARGHVFDVVFVPGLAERMFPKKLAEDPLFLDSAERHDLGLATREDRLADERLLLRLAIGAARDRVVLSYPRIDLDQGRPRVPSFYGLEVLEAAEGVLPGFDELARRANVTGDARIGWPAPAHPRDAIDEAEHDLALLDELVRSPRAPIGAAAYLLTANRHLARAMRTRARRWEIKAWKPADGLIVSTDEARAALAAHAPTARSFSPTALEQLAACPYRFALRTIVRLEPRATPEPIEALGALERGSLIHEVQFRLLGELRTAGALPVRPATLDDARLRLDTTLDAVAETYRDDLYPAIERVWADGITTIRADLREWLRRMSEPSESDAWVPHRFELAFGLGPISGGERDAASVADPVQLDAGLALRGSIDLVEAGPGGTLRATDYKTGKARVEAGALIDGGTSLQPIFYALALEKMFPGHAVAGGRLHYCTTRGDFREVFVPLDDDARDAARVVADTVAHHFAAGFFPAAPDDGACAYCDFRPVCGPFEEQRTKIKDDRPLAKLLQLRKMR